MYTNITCANELIDCTDIAENVRNHTYEWLRLKMCAAEQEIEYESKHIFQTSLIIKTFFLNLPYNR